MVVVVTGTAGDEVKRGTAYGLGGRLVCSDCCDEIRSSTWASSRPIFFSRLLMLCKGRKIYVDRFSLTQLVICLPTRLHQMVKGFRVVSLRDRVSHDSLDVLPLVALLAPDGLGATMVRPVGGLLSGLR